MQGQADRALRHFAYQGDLKWVSLMLWVGADPRSRGPTLHDDYEDDPECYTTAFEEACSKGNLDVLKKLKLDPARDELSALLRCASLFAGKETIGYLLEQGADPNDKANGGSSALARCIQQFRFGGFRVAPYSSLTPPYAVRETMDSVRLLVSRGARWMPEDKGELNSVRRVLYTCEPKVTVELARTLSQYKACSEETLQLLLNARMKEHLASTGTQPRTRRA